MGMAIEMRFFQQFSEGLCTVMQQSVEKHSFPT